MHLCLATLGLLATLALAASPAAGEALSDTAYADTQFSLLALGRLAEQGDARAAYLLGTRYASGRGGIRDDSQAVRWFKVAAGRGLAEAQYNLGVMMASGRGTPPDLSGSVRWFALAAEQAHAKAQHALGTMYATGRGVTRDEVVARQWLIRAAEQGEAAAQYNLGVFYEFGRGVGIDAAQALAWYERAAAAGYAPARERLAALKARLAVGTTPERAVPSPRPAPRPRVASSAPATDPLAGLPDAHQTIQLASHRSQADAEAALARLALPDGAQVLRTRTKGQIWFVIVTGRFASKASAKSAAARLPPEIRRLKPWVRSIGGLRAQLVP